ncbi:unnamed protein product [Mytilus edulis]|uniref:EGF-like domain-containing protein n=1 Tax=Mytilus edulis TaxID=6550 RepID=A0A8S3RK75_MYTED|nr:unnamed protein product [Mytilus edulis]
MYTLLQKAGIIDENNKIDISTWSNKQQIYHSDIDELEDLSQDELLSLNDEEILFTVVANDVELLHSADLLDMACDDIVDHAKDEELNLNGSEQSSNSEMHAPLADGPVALSTSLTETHQTTGQNEQLLHTYKRMTKRRKKAKGRQKRKFDEKKSGPPEKMTVQILKSLLKENGVRFTSKDKKADLVKLVKEKISSSNPSREIPSQCESEMEQRHKKRDIEESAQHVKKKKIKTIMIKRTIFFTFYSIPFDYSKHYLYTIYLHFLEILLILFDAVLDLCYGVACVNGGICSGGICACPLGYYGLLCEINMQDKCVDKQPKWTCAMMCIDLDKEYSTKYTSSENKDCK